MDTPQNQERNETEVSPEQSPKTNIDDPYRKCTVRRRRKNEVASGHSTEPGTKKKLEIVEEDLKNSRNEIEYLKVKVEEGEKERKEMLSRINSLYVQVQYWNSWLGKFSTHLKEKSVHDCAESKELNSEGPNNNVVEEMVATTEGQINVDSTVSNNGDINEINAKEGLCKSDNGSYSQQKKQAGAMGSDSVADMLKETAESAFADSGMAYDESSGLYYDWNTHMYYDPNTRLFYDNDNGIYYYYDSTKGGYVFYSQVAISSPNYVNAASPLSTNERSEGELSSSESETEQETAACIRAIVTAAERVKVGTLYLVTCTGATIGRDKINSFYVPDEDASKTHAVIKYEASNGTYYIKDEGSVNGTFLNSRRLSETKIKSKWLSIKHKDFLKIGNTVFVLHLHRGQETCDDCEPGQVQALLSSTDHTTGQIIDGSLSKEQLRKKHLRGLKEKYMVSGDGLKQALIPITTGKYKDRANKRRKQMGSEPIRGRIEEESKSCVTKMISEKNKGHQMMQKMGWKFGEGLGKEKSGIKEPINVVIREKKKGLGSGNLHSIDDHQKKGASQKWKKAKERYDEIVQDEGKQNNSIANDGVALYDF